MMRCLVLLVFVVMISGCADYEIKNVAKSDVDLVTDEFIDETRRLVLSLIHI